MGVLRPSCRQAAINLVVTLVKFWAIFNQKSNSITVLVRRIGGGFGGKETQSFIFAAICTLLSKKTKLPVKLRMDRDDDIIITGKRHDFFSEYEVGFDELGIIKGLKLKLASRCGSSPDLSGAINERALLHIDNAYYLENILVENYLCKTNTASNTAFRGFGGNQGMMAIENIIDHIAIHELGHAIVGLLAKHHAKMKKVVINLSAPSSPGYTLFEPYHSGLNTREALFEHLMILLAGRIAEEMAYGVSVTTGAINDFEEALKLAQKMIVYYGMGKKIIYPHMSDAYKEKIDDEVIDLINQAYECAEFIVRNCKELILEGADILKDKQILTAEDLEDIINDRYSNIRELKI